MKKALSGLSIVGLIVTVLLIGGCGEKQKDQAIQGTGTVEMTETTISSKVSGKIVKIPAEEGQAVKNGDLLAELDHNELDAQIKAAQANLDLAKLRFQKSQQASKFTSSASVNDSRAAQIAAAQNNLAVAKANLDDANRAYERMQKLFQGQLISQADFDQAGTRRNVAQAQYRAALNNVTLSKSNPNTEDIDTANKQSSAQIEQATSNLALLQIQLNNTQITAPADSVLSAKLVQVGELVSPGTALFTLLDYSKPWVKIYLSLNDVERVKLNQKAYVKLDAYDRKFDGRVSFISQEAEFTPKDFLSKDERVKQVFAVKIELNNKDGLFKAGLPVDVTIAGH